MRLEHKSEHAQQVNENNNIAENFDNSHPSIFQS